MWPYKTYNDFESVLHQSAKPAGQVKRLLGLAGVCDSAGSLIAFTISVGRLDSGVSTITIYP